MDYYLNLLGNSYHLTVPSVLRICEELKPFLSENPSLNTPEKGEITVSSVPFIEGPGSSDTVFPSESTEEIRVTSEGRCIVYVRKYQEDGFLTRSVLEKQRISVVCDPSYLQNMMNSDVLLKKLYLESFFLLNHSFILHSSLIQFDGSAVVFCAPKQAGKSTQAGLWQKEMGARILNGDRAGIRISEDEAGNRKFVAFGLPHAGSSSIYVNEGAPLKAIILLEQAPVNTLERIPEQLAFSRMFSQVNIPRTDELLLTLGMAHLEETVRSVPVYLLKCTPDVRAVHLVYNELFGKEGRGSHD